MIFGKKKIKFYTYNVCFGFAMFVLVLLLASSVKFRRKERNNVVWGNYHSQKLNK